MARLAGSAFTLVGSLSVVLDCPFDGPTAPYRVIADARRLMGLGITRIRRGDTIGSATPPRVQGLMRALRAALPRAIFIAHFHNSRGTGIANCVAALEAAPTATRRFTGGFLLDAAGALDERSDGPRMVTRFVFSRSSPSTRSITSRLRATLQRWPGASGRGFVSLGTDGAARPVDSVDGLRRPPLTTGPSNASGRSISFIFGFIIPVSLDKWVCRETGYSVLTLKGLGASSRCAVVERPSD